MTYEERERQICRECGENVKCPYIPRKMEYKCQDLSNTMYGWELGYKDAIDKAFEWLNTHAYLYVNDVTDAFYDQDMIRDFKKHMEEQQ